MTIEEKRPDPDVLLAKIQAEEADAKHGKLKIFLGYVAGVGKTYAMLEAAHQRREEGIDVVIGYVETHGRKETEVLAVGLELIPRKRIDYRGTILTEMDIDSVIARHPQLVLVDELAHTNAPGSRHPKRYQDVEEILAAGIDVYSTVNIQHLESLSDVVQQITGVLVHEKIPDRLLDEANEIELIDLPTDELLKRLRDGKVYISDQAMRALKKFFRKGNLTALRELSLRRAADRVDTQMLDYMQTKSIPGPWPAGEKILVCISSHPMGERLIRSGRRLADDLNAEWYVLFVETPQHTHMPLENRLRVQHFLNLAEELGARIVSTVGEDVASAVVEFAQEQNITKIIAGKPYRPRLTELLHGSVIDQIIRTSGKIDVYVVSGQETDTKKSIQFNMRPNRPFWRYGLSLLMVALVTIMGQPLKKVLDPTNLVMVYLLAVVIAAVYLGRGPAILASFVSVLAFDFFYINPIFTFTVNDTQYLLTFIGLLAVGLIISTSAAMLRDQIEAMKHKDHQTRSLLTLSRELTAAISLQQVLEIAIRSCFSLFDRESVILIPRNSHLEIRLATTGFEVDANELAVAEWAFTHHQPAGRGTDTLPAASIRFIPLLTANGPVGVFGIKPMNMDASLTTEQRTLLEGFANLIALAIERALLAESAAQSEMLRNTEKLQSALLNSISHELRTPLSSITGVLTSLGESERARNSLHKLNSATRIELLDSATDQARQLNRLVENLLNMTRLESGAFHLNLEASDLQDLIGTVVQQLAIRLKEHPVKIEVAENLPLVSCDPSLIAQVILNLLDNACKFSAATAPICIGAQQSGNHVEIYVQDSGEGLQEDELEKVFAKFYRGKRKIKTSGTGLGLSICKGIIEAHGGWIRAERNPDRGATFRFSLPLFVESQEQNG
jgi:two-component system sensor histidine kinase KdpD